MSSNSYHLDDDRRFTLNVVLTDEGVVFDLFDVTGELIATRGMTASEWTDHLFPENPTTAV